MAEILLSIPPDIVLNRQTPVPMGEPQVKINWTRSPGLLLLAIWLILMNLVTLVPLIASLGVLLNVLGVAAGVLILIGR